VDAIASQLLFGIEAANVAVLQDGYTVVEAAFVEDWQTDCHYHAASVLVGDGLELGPGAGCNMSVKECVLAAVACDG
jgi:hypothetical protein